MKFLIGLATEGNQTCRELCGWGSLSNLLACLLVCCLGSWTSSFQEWVAFTNQDTRDIVELRARQLRGGRRGGKLLDVTRACDLWIFLPTTCLDVKSMKLVVGYKKVLHILQHHSSVQFLLITKRSILHQNPSHCSHISESNDPTNGGTAQQTDRQADTKTDKWTDK